MVSLAVNGFLAKRGLEFRMDAMASGVNVNKAILEGTAQVGSGGNFPLTLLMNQGAPIRVVAVVAPNLKHQLIVPLDSRLQTMADLKGAQTPAAIGLIPGTSAEFYFQASAAANGVRVGQDVVIRNVSQPEQATMPAHLAGVVPWDSTVSLITQEQKNGRPIDVSYPYNVFQGNIFVRKEIFDEVPDVARAIAESFVEAELWLRLHPDRVVDAMVALPELRGFSRRLLRQQVEEYNLLYKPTYMFPLGRFWGMQNQDVAMWLHLQGRLKRPLVRKDYEAVYAPAVMAQVYDMLGWKVPVLPPYIPPGWSNKSVRTTLPPYETYLNMKAPQPWPERGDLTRNFRFGDRVHTA
jgi:sulfonate transport system substrate-binding protein